MSMLKKSISILLAVTLIESAALGSVSSQFVFDAESKNIPPFSDFGSVTGGKDCGSPGKIIIIQDLHCHPQVQKNIASIIDLLDDEFKINNIYLEGAQGDVDVGWLTSIKDKSFSDNAAQKLLEDGKLTGAEYYAYRHNSKLKLKGIENEEIHLANLKRLSQITELQPEITSILSNLSGVLKKTQKQSYGALNRKLASLSGKYRSGGINSADYYKKLLRYAGRLEGSKSFVRNFNVEIDDYPEILKFLDSSKKLKKINIKTVRTQISLIVDELKSILSYGEYSEFLARTNSLSNTDSLIKELAKLNAGGFIDFGKYKQAGEFISARSLAADINPVKLVDEERKFLKALQTKAAASEKEMLAVIISEMFSYFSDYYTASLTSGDYKYIKAFGTENYKRRWLQAAGSQDIYLLDKYDALLKEYYETNINRDEIFIKRIFGENTLSGINLIVCGGFHTQGLVKEFEEKGVSYSVITPKVTQDAAIASDIYNEMLISGFKAESFAIALQVISQGGSQKQFVQILETLLNDELKRNPTLNKEEFINETVNKICDLDEAELNGSVTASYNRPVNEGVKLNADGSIEVRLFFENTDQKRVIEINKPKKTPPYASMFGGKYAMTAAFWEWVYMLPFSSLVMPFKYFKKFLSKTFLKGLSYSTIGSTFKYKHTLIIADIFVSALLLISFSVHPLMLVSVPLYILLKGIIFLRSHDRNLHVKENFNIMILIGSLLTVPSAAAFVLWSLSAITFGHFAAAAVISNIVLHFLYNIFAGRILVASKIKNMKSGEIADYFYKMSEKLNRHYIQGRKMSKAEISEYNIMLKVLEKIKDAETILESLKYFQSIMNTLSEMPAGGYALNNTARVLSERLMFLSENMKGFNLREALDIEIDIRAENIPRYAYYLIMAGNAKNKDFLEEALYNNEYETKDVLKVKIYAYMLLKSQGFKIEPRIERAFVKKSIEILADFNMRKFMHDFEDNKWIFNEELKVYVAAIYIVLSNRYKKYMKFSDETEIYRHIVKTTRFGQGYNNANSSLLFGVEYLNSVLYTDQFLETVAHELAHKYLMSIGFKYGMSLDANAIHELYSDVVSIILNITLGRDLDRYLEALKFEFEATDIVSEEHNTARSQLFNILEYFSGSGYDIEWYNLLKVLNENIIRIKRDKKAVFPEFIMAALDDYASIAIGGRNFEKNISTINPVRVRKDRIVNAELMDKIFGFYASIFGGEYAASAPFWEWVYMLPGAGFFIEKSGFAKILSKTFLRSKSDEEIKEILKTGKAAKIADAAGIISFAAFLLSGAGIAGIAAFAFTRAVIFSAAHKGFGLSAAWKNRALISALAFNALLFFIPFAGVCVSLIVFGINLIPALAAGVSLNILLHFVYNKYIAPAFSMKKASVIDAELSAGEKQAFIADIIKSKLSEKLGISEEKITINSDYEIQYGSVGTLAELFYSGAQLTWDDDGNIFSNIPGSFLSALYDISGIECIGYIEALSENLADLREAQLKTSAEKRDKAANSLMNAFEDDVADFAKTAFIKRAFSAAITVPSFEEISEIAEEISIRRFSWSSVNYSLLHFLSGVKDMVKYFDDNTKNIMLFQCIEFFGYILQSQTWLSPALYDGQYGFMQDIAEAPGYERETAHTDAFDPVFKKIFSNHRVAQIIKTKEAALFEYIADRGNRSGSSLILPDSVGLRFKNLDIASLEDKVYSAYLSDEKEIASLLKQKNSRSITGRYFIIDCSQNEDIAAIAGRIDKYNAAVNDKLKIKEVLFYNAGLEEYVLSDKNFSFKTAFIFDFSEFTGDEKSGNRVSDLFTNIPAAYIADDDGFILDFGSRLDNFTINYLYLLMNREGIIHSVYESAAKRKDSALPQTEKAREYKKLYENLKNSLKKYSFFDGVKRVFYNIVMRDISDNIKRLDHFIDGAPVFAKDFNDIADEYRTFLNFLFYFQWSDRKDMGDMISDSERDALGGQFNGFITNPKNSSGTPFSQNTVLTASGMSSLKTIAAMLVSENISKIAFGENIYYENKDMLENMNAFVNKEKFYEGDTREILNLNCEAVFFDLISNNSEIPVADVKRVIFGLAERKYTAPFYVCIDNSMYPSFQFNGIFDAIDLPDNMYIIIYGSMQKMHQRGLEIVSSGFLTLMSNGHRHEEVLNGLKDASKFTSSEIDTFRHIALSGFADYNAFFARSKAMNDNAEETAFALNAVADMFGGAFRVYHPSLYSGEQKRMWEENGLPGIPFFFIKNAGGGNTNRISGFQKYLFKKFVSETPFSPLVRDSYGFDSFTTVTYGRDRAIRFNAGLDIGRDKERFLDAFAEAAYEYFMNSAYTHIAADELIGNMYSYIKEFKTGKKIGGLIYEYISSLKPNQILFLSDTDILKAFVICNVLNMEVPEILKSKAANILSNEIPAQATGGREAYIEALAYCEKPRENVMEELAQYYTEGDPSEQGAAAAALAEVLAQSVFAGGADDLDTDSSGYQGIFVSNILAAA